MSTALPELKDIRSETPNPSASALPTGETTRIRCPCIESSCLDKSAEQKKTPWEICLDYAKKHVNTETTLWKEEIDKLLIFATLFSGVAGTFAIESYHNVREDPGDTTVLLLKSLLILQLNTTNPHPNLSIDLDPQAPITATARRINTYNFLSLILSLSVVMAGILCLQWLREYGQDPHGIPGSRYEHLGIRFMRKEGMKKWGVFTILKLLPLILLLSLLLFFAGIIELLLGVDRSAAIAVSVVIGIASFFMLVTTVLPTFQSFVSFFFPYVQIPECPYKSPQAWILHQVLARPIQFITWAISKCRGRTSSDVSDDIGIFNLQTWSGYDWLVYSGYARSGDAIANVGLGVHWLGKMYLQEKEFAEALYQCVRDSSVLESLSYILTNRDPRRASSVRGAYRWSPPGVLEENEQQLQTQAHASDVVVFQTLAHLAEKIERGHPPTILFRERLELYCKINDIRLDTNVDCPLMDNMNQQEVIPRDTRIALLRYIINLLKEKMDVNETHLSALEHILGVELETVERLPDLQLFQDVLAALRSWIKHKGWYPVKRESEVQDAILKSKKQSWVLQLENRIHILYRLAIGRRT